ncbi:MAG: tRNA (pseudouridine(54)-N(1))-methyltransferase TrmY [Candidatus Aenigmarchaeota archaeon]|nr:tRNA (pseudouridine(54)-N(1))-methyltransferase TrmY [Candidatus Aenigmarchaeota archaeon]
MREFILFSRTARTDDNFKFLREGGRLDVVYQCILMSIFSSHRHRNTKLHAILNGPPNPPLHLEVDGSELRDARVDEKTWENILRKVLSGGKHPGIRLGKKSFQELVKEKNKLYVLEERGKDIVEVEFDENPVFVLGDQVGLPKKDEGFALRYGEKISLGKGLYLSSSAIDIVNWWLDRKGIQ